MDLRQHLILHNVEGQREQVTCQWPQNQFHKSMCSKPSGPSSPMLSFQASCPPGVMQELWNSTSLAQTLENSSQLASLWEIAGGEVGYSLLPV